MAAARAWTRGVPVDWAAFFDPATPPTQLPIPEEQRPPADDRFWELVERGDARELAATLGIGAADGARSSLEAVLPALSSWRRRQREAADLGAHRYRIDWKPLTGLPDQPLTGAWPIVVPASHADHDLVAAVTDAVARAGGHPCSLAVEPGRTDSRKLADALGRAAGDRPVAGVLSLLALDETRHPDHPAVPAGLSATVHLVQALDLAGIRARLWCATVGAVATPHQAVTGPVQAHLWGLGAVARLEDPGRFAGLVDLPPELDDETAAQLSAVLGHPGPEDQIALAPGGPLARRLLPAASGSGTGARWRPRGTVLVTGGTGALGAHVSRWLARNGAPRLLLLSKRGDGAPGADDLRRELTDLGAEVGIATCDIGDRTELADALARIPAEHPLSAVFHTAGTVDDCLVGDLTPSRLATVLGSKSAGAANLHELTRDLDLSAFVLFSSYGSLLPNAGQGSYAAANAYLDALARHRRAEGLVATSIAWGAWSGGGMAKDEEFVKRIARGGMRLLSPDLATAALQQVLDDDEASTVIADVDWSRFASVYGADRPRPLAAEIPEVADAMATTPAPAIRLTGLPRAHQEVVLLNAVRGETARVMGHRHPGDVRPDRPFRDLGLDSVSGVELRNRLVTATGLSLSRTAIFDYPTPAALAAQLLAQVADGSAPAGVSSESSSPPEQPSRIDAMPVEDLLRMAHRGKAADSPQEGA